MGLLARIERRSVEDPAVPLTSAAVLEALGGSQTHAGVRVTEQGALAFGAVGACVSLIAGSIGSLPIHLTERLEPRGRRRLPSDSRYGVLRWKANPEMDSMTFVEMLQAHVETWGNGYAEKEFDGAGRLIGLWPLLPDRTRVERRNGVRTYYTRVRRDLESKEIPLPPSKVFHVAGLGFDGLRGYSVVGMMRQAIAIGMAADEFAARFYGSGMHTGGVLMHPTTLSDKAADRLRTDFENKSAGLSMAHRLLILEEGLKFEKTSVPPDDAQFLQSRLFQRREICGWYGVPPDMIGDLEHGAAYASTEARALSFKQQCLRVRIVRWERALGVQLLDEKELARLYFAFNTEELERGDSKSRADVHNLYRTMGVFSADDVREKLDENPLPDGQGALYLVPLNMMPADQVAAQAEGGDGGGDDEGRADEPADDARAARLELLLGRLRRAYHGLFAEALGRIARREVKELMPLAALNASEFTTRATEFYGADKYRRDAERDLLPPIEALARLLREEMVGLYGETRHEATAAAKAETESAIFAWRTDSLDELRGGLAAGRVAAVLEEWADSRAASSADAIVPTICAELARRFREE